MSDLQEQFEQAAKDVKTIDSRPDNNTLLKLYALYKQASEGDVSGKRPGFTNIKGRAKYDAWKDLKGTSKDQAMKDYIALVEELTG